MSNDKVYAEGHWYNDSSIMALCYVAPGYYDPAIQPPIEKTLTHRELPALIEALDRLGYLKPRLDDRLRAEDLKIMHRLMDMLERNQP